MTKRSVRETPKLKKGPKTLPAFETVDDAAEFFETHDTAPYLDQMEGGPEELVLDRKLKARILRRARKKEAPDLPAALRKPTPSLDKSSMASAMRAWRKIDGDVPYDTSMMYHTVHHEIRIPPVPLP